MRRIRFWILIALLAVSTAPAQQLLQRLREIPGVVSVKPTRGDSLFKESYELEIEQPLDHKRLAGPIFHQRVVVSELDSARPVLLVTEGYAMGSRRAYELARYLTANQVIVEHRFFGTSRPDSLAWSYLTVKQAADDLHRVVMLLKQIYKGPWISTGISKGGQTTLYYRYCYPNDVVASVPYVGPMNIAQEDPRVFTFLRTVGSKECRDRIMRYQRTMLKDESRMLPLFEQNAREKKFSFSRLGLTTAYEYSVLEYSFSFWQWGRVSCDSIPDSTAPDQERFAHLAKAVSAFDYSDSGIVEYEPFFYQAYTEVGYYGYDITEFRPYLHAVKMPTNRVLAPRDVRMDYNCSTLQEIVPWLQSEAKNIIYLYGENDPWSASAIQLYGTTNCLKIMKPGGNHTTRINNLPEEQRTLVLSTLKGWVEDETAATVKREARRNSIQ